jgi:hypothetical protein
MRPMSLVLIILGAIFCIWGAFDVYIAISSLTSGGRGLLLGPDDPENYPTLVFGSIITAIGIVSIFLANRMSKKRSHVRYHSQ